MQIPDQIVKLLEGKNSAMVALLIIAIGLAYALADFASELLSYNKSFIENITKTNEKLDRIYEVLRNHDEKHLIK